MRLFKRIVPYGKTIVTFIVGAFFGAFLSYFVWQEIMEKLDFLLFGKAEVIINITELNKLEPNKEIILENSSLRYTSANGVRWIFLADLGQPDLTREFGISLIPEEFSDTKYNILIKNKGNGIAKDLNLRFTGDNLKMDYINDVSSNIDYINCGDFDEAGSCEMKIEKLSQEQEATFFVKADQTSVNNISCEIKGISECYINRRIFYIAEIEKNNDVGFMLNSNIASSVPPINPKITPVTFWYDSTKNYWVPVDKNSPEFLIAERNFKSDLAFIPDNAVINGYTIVSGENPYIEVDYIQEK